MTKSWPDPLTEVLTLAARQELGCVESAEYPVLADQVLTLGVVTPSLVELAVSCGLYPTAAEVRSLLVQVVRELGLSWPSRVESAWLIARWTMERIVLGGVPPVDALEALQCAAWTMPIRECVGDGLDAADLMGIYYLYDEPTYNVVEETGEVFTEEAARRRRLDEHAMQRAKEWLERHAAR